MLRRPSYLPLALQTKRKNKPLSPEDIEDEPSDIEPAMSGTGEIDDPMVCDPAEPVRLANLVNAIAELNLKLQSLQVESGLHDGPGYTQSLDGHSNPVRRPLTYVELLDKVCYELNYLRGHQQAVSVPMWYAFHSFRFGALTDCQNLISRLCPSLPKPILSQESLATWTQPKRSLRPEDGNVPDLVPVLPMTTRNNSFLVSQSSWISQVIF